MKKLIIALAIILISIPAFGFDVSPPRTIQWEQDIETLAILERWELYMSDAETGPWAKLFDIPKPVDTSIGEFSGEYILTVSGQIGKTVTKYFVLIAIAKDETGAEIFSEDSNVASSDFKIVPGKPFNLKVNVTAR